MSAKDFLAVFGATESLNIAVNCHLLELGVRPSFLILNCDYEQRRTEQILEAVKATYDFNFYVLDRVGTLIYKSELPTHFTDGTYTELDLGNFLGYPCSGDHQYNREYMVDYVCDYAGSTESFMAMVTGSIEKLEPFNSSIKAAISDLSTQFTASGSEAIDLQIKVKKTYDIKTLISFYMSFTNLRVPVGGSIGDTPSEIKSDDPSPDVQSSIDPSIDWNIRNYLWGFGYAFIGEMDVNIYDPTSFVYHIVLDVLMNAMHRSIPDAEKILKIHKEAIRTYYAEN